MSSCDRCGAPAGAFTATEISESRDILREERLCVSCARGAGWKEAKSFPCLTDGQTQRAAAAIRRMMGKGRSGS